MPIVGIHSKGFDLTDMVKQLERKFNKEEILRIFAGSAEVAYKRAYDLCPVDTGKMQGMITMSVSELQFALLCDCEYASYNEYGWCGIPIVPNPPETVHHRGGYRPFLRIGIIEGREVFLRSLRVHIKNTK